MLTCRGIYQDFLCLPELRYLGSGYLTYALPTFVTLARSHPRPVPPIHQIINHITCDSVTEQAAAYIHYIC
jgi:hypothetical protein